MTDAAGTVTDPFCYGPYGTDWGRSGTNSIPFRWLGSHGVLAAVSLFPASGSSLQTLPSSLYLTRHRAYDAALGRFLSADPLGLGGGPNVYAYCLGNPLAYIDPLGLCGDPLAGLKEFNRTHPGYPSVGIDDMSFEYIAAVVPIELPIVGKILDSVIGPVVNLAAKSFDGVVAKVMARKASGEIAGQTAKSGVPTIMGHTPNLRNPAQIDQIKADMLSGNYRFNSPEGIIAGVEDLHGVIHLTEGQHRMNAALEIFEQTRNPQYLNQLLDASRSGWNGRSYLVPGNPPAYSVPLPRR